MEVHLICRGSDHLTFLISKYAFVSDSGETETRGHIWTLVPRILFPPFIWQDNYQSGLMPAIWNFDPQIPLVGWVPSPPQLTIRPARLAGYRVWPQTGHHNSMIWPDINIQGKAGWPHAPQTRGWLVEADCTTNRRPGIEAITRNMENWPPTNTWKLN